MIKVELTETAAHRTAKITLQCDRCEVKAYYAAENHNWSFSMRGLKFWLCKYGWEFGEEHLCRECNK